MIVMNTDSSGGAGMVAILGVGFILFGIYGYFHPSTARDDLVQTREWVKDPEQAERKHEGRAKLVAIFFIVFGILLFIIGTSM